jgi:hypothetical protein
VNCTVTKGFFKSYKKGLPLVKILTTPRIGNDAESLLDYEYLHKVNAKIEQAQAIVGTYAELNKKNHHKFFTKFTKILAFQCASHYQQH